MSIGSASDPSRLESLSALADGELDSSAVARAVSSFRDDAELRSAWHAYQLIGDVMRSEDLASNPTRDAQFLSRLREQLANEPAILAPQPASPLAPSSEPVHLPQVANAGRHTRWTWMAPSAVAAGFVLVTGALLATRMPTQGGSDESWLARIGLGGAAPNVATAVVPAGTESALVPQAVGVDGKVIRDRRLDRYLQAHKQFAGSSALTVPSEFLRNAAAEANQR